MLKPVSPIWFVTIGALIGLLGLALLTRFQVDNGKEKRMKLNRITWDRISELEVRVFLLEKKLGLNKMSP